MILGIDPGTLSSGVVLFNEHTKRVVWSMGQMGNHVLLHRLRMEGWNGAKWTPMNPSDKHIYAWNYTTYVIEGLSPRGMNIGWDVMLTLEWVGRFQEAIAWRFGEDRVSILRRDDIKKELFGKANVKAADKHVRQYCIDTLGKPGLKRVPGPTYGVASHAWQALGAVMAWRQQRDREREDHASAAE